MYENKEICSSCKGKCCKTIPGTAYPDDFDNSIDKIKSALDTGRWAVDWWEGDPREDMDELCRAYYIRPAVKGMEGITHHESWGGECTFLTDDGCELTFEDRPKECRYLEPIADEISQNCTMRNGYGKRGASIEWLPFTGILEEV